MSTLVPIRRALLSVSDKTDLIPFARALADFGVELVSTGGTAAKLIEAGLNVITIDQVTGFPEMMDGRVKTLHPAVHGALLGRRDEPTHLDAMKQHGITPIDLVCVNLYPFERVLREDLSEREAIELIDIGGPAMLRSAAKNHEFITVITAPRQYDRVINDLRNNDGATTMQLRRDLAAAAFSRTAEYDAAISAWMAGRVNSGDRMPAIFRISQPLQGDLRYGENPHQAAAVYHDPAARGPDVVSANLLHGKALSYNNLLDASAALELVYELAQLFPRETAAAIIKHTNPCGAAIAPQPAEAFSRAYEGDPLAAFGGILAISSTIDDALADSIAEGKRFLEVIIAPAFTDTAARRLGERWKDVRLLAVGEFTSRAGDAMEFKSITGGMLLQQRDRSLADPARWTLAAGHPLDEPARRTAALAWMVAKHLKSNAIAIARDGQLLGAGAGQMDRITSARLAIEKAGDRLNQSSTEQHRVIAASDGFFPFADGPTLLLDAGINCLIQPGGSKRDQDTITLCQERNATLLLTGIRHFRH